MELNGFQWFVVILGVAATITSAGFSVWSTYLMATGSDAGAWTIVWVIWCLFWTLKWATIPMGILAEAQKRSPLSSGAYDKSAA